ncbi:unnamed protein product [Bathycoccus prasinos]
MNFIDKNKKPANTGGIDETVKLAAGKLDGLAGMHEYGDRQKDYTWDCVIFGDGSYYEGLVDIYGQCEHLGVMSFEDGDRYEGGFNQGAQCLDRVYITATASYFWANLKEIKSLGAV